MSKKHKKRATIQPLRSVRTIREVGMRSYLDDIADAEINDGDDFQARDGSNLRTMAEAEADDRREAQVEAAQAVVIGREVKEAATDKEFDRRTIPQVLWSLLTGPINLAIALLKIPLEVRNELARGRAT